MDQKNTIHMATKDTLRQHNPTNGQKSLWLFQKTHPLSSEYNLSYGFRALGEINAGKLEHALLMLASRHAALRSHFTTDAEENPNTIITPQPAAILETVDASSWNEKDIETYIKSNCFTPFDLEKPPLWRAKLISLSGTESIFLVVFHHIIFDGLSIWVFFEELETLYLDQDPFTFRTADSDETDYPTYVQWQEDIVLKQEKDAHQKYWNNLLPNGLPSLDLPKNPHGDEGGAAEGYLEWIIEENLSKKIREVCRNTETSQFRLLLACYHILMHRYTGEDLIPVGVSMSARGNGHFDKSIGYFSNLAPIVTDFREDHTAEAIIEQVSTQIKTAKHHQNYPLGELLNNIDFERNSNFMPFETCVTHQKPKNSKNFSCLYSKKLPQTATWANLPVESAGIILQKPTSNIDFQIIETHEKTLCTFKFKTQSFNENFVSSLLNHYASVLEDVVSNINVKVSQIDLLKNEKGKAVFESGRNTSHSFQSEKCIHELFEEQVEKSPESIAVFHGNEQLTYRELNNKANQIAHYLIQRGVKPDSPVALCLERSLDLIVALWGILKSGGAYVPLDPSHPAERLQGIIANAGIKEIITRKQIYDTLTFNSTAAETPSPLFLDSKGQSLPAFPTSNPSLREPASKPENLAYIIYTSGSTGSPKGVMVQHQSVANLLFGLTDILGVGACPKPYHAVLNASLSFDASVQQLLHLLNGGTLHIISEDIRREPAQLLGYLRYHAIRCIDITPSLVDLLVQEAGQAPLSTQPLSILVGGEAISAELWNTLANLENSVCFNVYGPTECTVDTTCVRITSDDRFPILGKPLPNVECYVLDKYRQPVPAGIPGELYVGGCGLARGYLNQPELTAKAFLENPFRPGTKIYKTGDLVRYHADGNLEFIGRSDFQIKIRGFRIEAGEIETRLCQHQEVQAAILAAQGVTANKHLVAYVIPTDKSTLVDTDKKPSLREVLRNYLAAYLPSYMVPSIFVFVESFRLNANGKIDLKALPKPILGENTGKNYVEATSETEMPLLEIWRGILGIRHISIQDNFFDLGGHSLLAMRMISQIDKVMSKKVSMSAVFSNPTIFSLAAHIDSSIQTGPSFNLSSAPRNAKLPIASREINEISAFGWQPWRFVTTVRLNGKVDISILVSSLEKLVDRHHLLRTSYNKEYMTRHIEPAHRFQVDYHDCQSPNMNKEERFEKIKHQWSIESSHPCDLSRGPLFRSSILQLSAEDLVLYLSAPHVIYDFETWEIIISETFSLYYSQLHGTEPLSPLTLQYADYAYWEKQWLESEACRRGIQRNIDRLVAISPPARFPHERMTRKRPETIYRSISVSFEKNRFNQLTTSKGGRTITNYVLLITAISALLIHDYDRSDIVIHSSASNRSKAHTDNMLGHVSSNILLHNVLDLSKDFTSLAVDVMANFLEANNFIDFPTSPVIRHIKNLHPWNLSPFGVFFNYHPAVVKSGTMPDFSITSYDFSYDQIFNTGEALMSSDIDLLIYLIEDNDLIKGYFRYDSNLFSGDDIENLARRLSELLNLAAQSARRPVQTLLEEIAKECVLFDGAR